MRKTIRWRPLLSCVFTGRGRLRYIIVFIDCVSETRAFDVLIFQQRAGFFRDMVMGGPYFSTFLLNVIFAHASRHIPDTDPLYVRVGQGEEFLKKAKHLLLSELEAETPRIPTIQGLLILGGRQCAVGKNSEGWLYTGMVQSSHRVCFSEHSHATGNSHD